MIIVKSKERLDTIAQVIAECDGQMPFWCTVVPRLIIPWYPGSDWNNVRQGFRMLVYGILCDEDVF